ncbi:MAG: Secretin N-terminal domain [Phormidesmis priestleyi Ana]|uniref:Secretin N-terminal domain n=1 Tax=Phormidesmis priestleyi Ana TaxID=1666911 RepID=A0A0P7ZC14_9CYAN|nr:MAG: Secretin N-terminal domain [Phormidesmis priestleyi Ana]
MKKAIIALLAFGTLSAAAIPAQADTATVIDGRQTSITTGTDNHQILNSTQDVNNRNRNTGDNTGTSMRSDQYSDIYGTGNTTIQHIGQSTDNTSVRTVPSRPAR